MLLNQSLFQIVKVCCQSTFCKKYQVAKSMAVKIPRAKNCGDKADNGKRAGLEDVQ